MILGLDASTSVVGWCILKQDGEVLDAGHVSFDKNHDLYQKLRHLRESLGLVLELAVANQAERILRIYLEEPKKMFGNKSTAHVMSLLQRWNGMVSAWLAIDYCPPHLINEKSARKAVGITIPKECKNAKALACQFVQEQQVLPEKIWQYKRTGNLKDHCMDISDAYVVARAGYLRDSC